VPDISEAETAATSLDDVIDVLRACTAFDLSEPGGIHHDNLDHSLQTAEVLRRSHPNDPELQIAGLVHDVGHVLGPRRDDVHAEVGSIFVRPVLGARIAELVRLHVPAKRYLVTTESHYRDGLNGDSIMSLEHQGGDMSVDEVSDFEDELFYADAVVLRRADEAGKVPGLAVPPLDSWISILRSSDYRLQWR
jgi:predicted HD phosphohydrolase